jgi:hypothetical protein
MELIKKTILQALTTGITTNCTGTCKVIIPDLNAVYFIKFSLTNKTYDFGFFDAYVEPVIPTPPEPVIPIETFYYVDDDGAIFIDSDGVDFIWE